MMLKLKYPLLLIILSILFYSCEKEYSLEGSVIGGTSVFTFTGAPGACANAVVAGTYKVDTALVATDIVTLSVDVASIGTYIISTSTNNGFTFSGSGTFNTTGLQTIVLTGTGKPIATGTFSFNLGINGCTFPVTVTSGGGSSGGTAVFTLNGAPGNCAGFTTAGTYAAGTPLASGNTATVGVNVTTIGTYTIATNTLNGITFAGTGSFIAPGPQTVVLTGVGTPLVGGPFDYTPGTVGCKFIINVTGSTSGSAVFTYGGAPNACTSAVPAGTYTASTPLTTANTVAVSVNVTTLGTYLISTPLVTGFSFAGSGSFTTLGAQTVTLTGTGTPNAAGTSTFVLSNNGCTFPVTVVAVTAATDFLICTIDGVAQTFNVNLALDQVTADTLDIGGYTSLSATSPSFQLEIRKAPSITSGIYTKYVAVTNTTVFCFGGYSDGVAPLPWITSFTTASTDFTVTVTTNTPTRIAGTFSGNLYDNLGTGPGKKVITAGSFSVAY